MPQTPTYGDRELVAAMFEQHAPRLRSRIRRSLSPSVRRLFDSQDVLSTVRRRLDVMAAKGEILASNEDQFVNLILTMSQHATTDKARIARRLREAPIEDPDWDLPDSAPQSPHLEEAFTEIYKVLSPDDALVLNLWMQGTPYQQIAELLDCSPGSVKHQWRRIRTELRKHLEDKIGDPS